MAIANFAMATGNLGREGVGVNPLRGQNNVQGACDMGSFPHEFSGYRHVSDSSVRELFEGAWGVKLHSEPGLRIRTCSKLRSMALSKPCTSRARIRCSPIPTPTTSARRWNRWSA